MSTALKLLCFFFPGLCVLGLSLCVLGLFWLRCWQNLAQWLSFPQARHVSPCAGHLRGAWFRPQLRHCLCCCLYCLRTASIFPAWPARDLTCASPAVRASCCLPSVRTLASVWPFGFPRSSFLNASCGVPAIISSIMRSASSSSEKSHLRASVRALVTKSSSVSSARCLYCINCKRCIRKFTFSLRWDSKNFHNSPKSQLLWSEFVFMINSS